MEVSISLLLDRFKNLRIPNESLRKEVQIVLKNIFDEEVGLDDIKIVKGTVHLNIDGPLRSEVLLRKEEILKDLENSLGEKTPKNIF
jgi:hypothetical protein